MPAETIDNPNQLIAAIFTALDKGLARPEGPMPGKKPRYKLTLPSDDEIDHSRFTRAYLNFNGMDITISAFSGTASHEREVPPFDISKNPREQQLSMAMMVLKRYADGEKDAVITPQDAQRIHDAIADEFRVLSKPAHPLGLSRWPASHMAQLLWSEVGRTIVSDAAFYDAIALIGTRIDLTDYLPEESSPEVQEAVMRAQEA